MDFAIPAALESYLAELDAFIAAEIKRWAQVVKASGAKLD